MSGIDGKYGEITSSKKEFHPEEPIFLFRATDPLAPVAIRYYGEICRQADCAPEHTEAVFRHASRIEDWQRQHPDLVKEKPGPSQEELNQ